MGTCGTSELMYPMCFESKVVVHALYMEAKGPLHLTLHDYINDLKICLREVEVYGGLKPNLFLLQFS